MLTSAPIFDYHYVVYVKDDPAREPITVGASIPAVLADAAEKIGRSKSDFEVQQISKERFEKLKQFLS
jgi:hypothetical protein